MSAGGAKDDNVGVNSVAKVSNPIVFFLVSIIVWESTFFFFWTTSF